MERYTRLRERKGTAWKGAKASNGKARLRKPLLQLLRYFRGGVGAFNPISADAEGPPPKLRKPVQRSSKQLDARCYSLVSRATFCPQVVRLLAACRRIAPGVSSKVDPCWGVSL